MSSPSATHDGAELAAPAAAGETADSSNTAASPSLYPVTSGNVQDTSTFLTTILFSCQGFADLLRDSFELPDFGVVSFFQYYKEDLITLDIVPWH